MVPNSSGNSSGKQNEAEKQNAARRTVTMEEAMEEAEEASGEEENHEEEEALLMLEAAVGASNLPIPDIPADIGSLESGQAARFICEMLANAGIVLELVDGVIDDDDHLYEFVQIVEDGMLEKMLAVEENSEICLAPMERMQGFQMKLSGEKKWKIKVADQNKDHHSVSRSRTARSAHSETSSEFKNHNLHEIFVPLHDSMHATIAVSNVIIITVLFEIDDASQKSRWEDDSPVVYQRRIDMVFHNKYCARLQVRAVLRSTFCVLRSIELQSIELIP